MSRPLLEVGPGVLRRLPPAAGAAPDREALRAALAGIDDRIVLLDERPVDVMSLWRDLIASALGPAHRALTVVHPSWWPRRRIGRIVDAAAGVADDVDALGRAALIERCVTGCAVVEIGDEFVAVVGAGRVHAILDAGASAAVLAAHARRAAGSGPIVIDIPAGVPGSEDSATAIRALLSAGGVPTQLVRLDRLPLSGTRPPTGPPAGAHRRSRLPVWTAAAAVAVSLCGVGLVSARSHPTAPAIAVTELVERHVAVRVPVGWVVARITAGPGSRRVRVSSPTDGGVALHITQSAAPGESPARAAEALRLAAAAAPPGVFVDFNPDGRTGGRPAITYREVRAGREVRWSVVLDGSMRISIGCQSAPGHQAAIRPACDEAVRSAREVTGTEPPD